MNTISVIDSHTGGEPTRIVVDGGPDLGSGTIAEQAEIFAKDFSHILSAVIGEPRGSEVMVGGLLCEPKHRSSAAGIVFFDNAGLLGMCGHGSIGFAVTLHHLGRIGLGSSTFETRVGPIEIEMLTANRVRIKNVASYRSQKDVEVDVPGYGPVVGDIAWGGNWFFIVKQSPIELRLSNTGELLRYTGLIRDGLQQGGYRGDDGGEVNHIELQGPAVDSNADARNFVLCPGGAYDRSPCGTGTSAKLACLAADGEIEPGQMYRLESIVGSVFEASYSWGDDGAIIPTICGSAHISGETTLILDPSDPFRHGITA